VWASVVRALRLSPREAQIVLGILDGLSESGLSGSMGVSVHTVHTYVRRLYAKLGVSTRAQLVIYVFASYVDSKRDGTNAPTST
jgi:DNA-binding CsgD family transcriptional regulator